MDLADDIAYSLHDVEDFHRSGVLQFSPVSGEFRSWENGRQALAELEAPELVRAGRQPGAGSGAVTPPAVDPRRLDLRRRHLRRRGGRCRRRVRRRGAGHAVRRLDGGRSGDLGLRLALDRPPDHLGQPDARCRGPFRLRRDELAGLARGLGAQVRPPVLHPRSTGSGHVPARPGADAGGAGHRLRPLAVGPDGRRAAPAPAGRPGQCRDAGLRADRPGATPTGWMRKTTDADLARMGRGAASSTSSAA